MLILGISNNDVAGACLVENGNILSAVHEERFSRIKSHNTWPEKSINYVLKKIKNLLMKLILFPMGGMLVSMRIIV